MEFAAPDDGPAPEDGSAPADDAASLGTGAPGSIGTSIRHPAKSVATANRTAQRSSGLDGLTNTGAYFLFSRLGSGSSLFPQPL
ncbi:hypothetical protein GCM10027403_06300 [Arthrobacter tecti]